MPFYLLAFLIALNYADGVFTLQAIESGRAVEFNPVMRYAMEVLGNFWLPAKIFFVSALGTFLTFNHHKPLAKKGLWLTTIVYLVILIYHLKGL